MKKINLKQWQEFFKRPRVLGWAIAILTLVIVTGVLKVLVWSIYTNDKPSFVPEEIREEVRGAIVEKIGKPLQSISNPAGTFVINAAYKSQGNGYGLEKQEDKTKNWPTYTDDELGITLKYPVGLSPDTYLQDEDTYRGTITWNNSEGPVLDVDVFVLESGDPLEWVSSLASESGLLSEISEIKIKGLSVVKATEAGDPDHYIYVVKKGDLILKYKAPFESEEVLLDVVEANL